MKFRPFRVLMVSDIHMSNRLPQAKLGPDGVSDRLQDQVALWKRINAAAVEYKVDRMMVLGDLFDKSQVDAVTLTTTVEAITSAPSKVSIIGGNHDAVSTKGGRFTVEAFGKTGNKNVEYLKTGDRLQPLPDQPWLGFWPIEYCVQEKARAWLASIQEKMPDRHEGTTEVLLLHHSIIGCEHVGWTCDDGLTPEEVCSGFDYVFSGHFHTSQTFGPNKTGLYLGAPLHLRIEDEGRKAGFWIVEFTPGGKPKRHFIDGGCPRFHKWEHPFKKFDDLDAKPGDYIRLEVSATHADWELQRPGVLNKVDELNLLGYRASFKHKPLYHHTVRIGAPPGAMGARHSAGARPEDAADAYVDAPDVDTTGLDLKRLKQLGRDAIESARAEEKWAS